MHIPQRKPRVQLTLEQEKAIRRAFFTDRVAPDKICLQYGIGEARLRVIIGGPLFKKTTAIEHVYS